MQCLAVMQCLYFTWKRTIIIFISGFLLILFQNMLSLSAGCP